MIPPDIWQPVLLQYQTRLPKRGDFHYLASDERIIIKSQYFSK